MEIMSVLLAVVVVAAIWWIMKGIATLVGMVTIAALAYYAHSTYPNWVHTLSTSVEQWLM